MKSFSLVPATAILLAALWSTGSLEAQTTRPKHTEFLGQEIGFSNIAKTTIGAVTTVRVAGQVGRAANAEAPGADLAEQAKIAFENLVLRLEEAGATISDLVKTTVYIKDIDPQKVSVVGAAQGRVLQVEAYPASTWIGVTGLVDPRLLVEVEGTAIIVHDP